MHLECQRGELGAPVSLNSEVGRQFHRDSLVDFLLRWRGQDATSAKLEDRRLTPFPAAGCVAAGRPRKRTDAGPGGGRPGRARPCKGRPEPARWPAPHTPDDLLESS